MNHRSSNAYRPPPTDAFGWPREFAMNIPGLKVVPFHLPKDKSCCDMEPPITSSSIPDKQEPGTESSLSSSQRILRPATGSAAAPRRGRTPAVKKGFVAMPSPGQWNQGFRPGWLVNNPKSPPEDYSDALKMFHLYKKTGKLIYPVYLKGKKKKEDKVATYANNYKQKL